MPLTYKDLKNKRYFEPTRNFAESVLNIKFQNGNRSFCPFHKDTKDSFRIYVTGKDEVRFHCFGECGGDWDIYDIIMLKDNCNFSQAQMKFAKHLGIKDVEFHKGLYQTNIENKTEQDEQQDEPVTSVDAEDLTDEHRHVLQEAVEFYNNLLLSENDDFGKVIKYLKRRGVDESTIDKYNIGFCPALKDEKYGGRALLNQYRDIFNKDLPLYQCFRRAGLFRLLNDESAPGYIYYRQFIDRTDDNVFGVYADYFVNRITFPIYNINGQIEGIIGRRTDNHGIQWLKQTQEDTFIKSKGWLYGIDKAAMWIKEYQTVIIVEGIFDYFAFYNISENKDHPIVISTLGIRIDDTCIDLLADLGVKHFIIAFDGDRAGRKGISAAAKKIADGKVSYLGSLKPKEDPADKLKGIVSGISNFAIRHLQKGMDIKSPSGRTVVSDFLVLRRKGKKSYRNEIIFKPHESLNQEIIKSEPTEPSDYWYLKSDLLPSLTYDSGNRAALNHKINEIRSYLDDPLKDPPPEESQHDYFHLPRNFIQDEHYINIGDALILHLRLAIEQQTRERRIKESDSTIAEWMGTTRRNIQKYKHQLKEAGLIDIRIKGIQQSLSVKYFSKNSTDVVMSKS